MAAAAARAAPHTAEWQIGESLPNLITALLPHSWLLPALQLFQEIHQKCVLHASMLCYRLV